MKILLSVTLALVCCVSVFSQKENSVELQDVLKPPPEDVQQAEAAGLKIFKLLPRGMFKQLSGSYSDEDNPIGIREGGAYYSFSTGSHSYNKQPQIELAADGDRLSVGFAGLDYGFMNSLGEIPLGLISLEQPDIVSLAAYSPPHSIPDIRAEQGKRRDGTYNRECPWLSACNYVVGHTYALRAILYDQADVLVAINVVRKLDDGSLVIMWKPLKTFEVPHAWYLTDEQLQVKVDEMLAPERFVGIKGTVKDNIITLTGSTTKSMASGIGDMLFHGLRPTKVVNNLMVIDSDSIKRQDHP